MTLEVHPLQSQKLQDDIIAWNVLGEGDVNQLTVDYYDSVNDAIMTMSEMYHLTPYYVIAEMCLDDYPEDPNQRYNKGTINGAT